MIETQLNWKKIGKGRRNWWPVMVMSWKYVVNETQDRWRDGSRAMAQKRLLLESYDIHSLFSEFRRRVCICMGLITLPFKIFHLFGPIFSYEMLNQFFFFYFLCLLNFLYLKSFVFCRYLLAIHQIQNINSSTIRNISCFILVFSIVETFSNWKLVKKKSIVGTL